MVRETAEGLDGPLAGSRGASFFSPFNLSSYKRSGLDDFDEILSLESEWQEACNPFCLLGIYVHDQCLLQEGRADGAKDGAIQGAP